MMREKILIFLFALISCSSYSQTYTCNVCDLSFISEKENYKKLSQDFVDHFLCTFSEACKDNVTYSERSNELLYLLLEKYPSFVITSIIQHPEFDRKKIFKEISAPLADQNFQRVYRKVKKVPASEIKNEILQAIKNAASNYEIEVR